MKTYFILPASRKIQIFTILLFCFSCLNANRTWIIFKENNSAIYAYGPNVHLYDFLKNESHPIITNFIQQPRSQFYIKDIGFDWNSASLQDTANIWATGSRIENENTTDALLKSNGIYFLTQDGFYGHKNKLFLSENAETLASLINQNNDSQLILKHIVTNTIYKLDTYKYKIDLSDLRTLDMTNDGAVLALNFYKSGSIYIWKPETNETFMVHSKRGYDYFYNFALSPDGSLLFTISENGSELWNIKSNSLEVIFRWDKEIKASTLVDNDDSNTFYAPLFPPPTTKDEYVWENISQAIFSADSKYIFMLTKLERFYAKNDVWEIVIYDINTKNIVNSIALPKLDTIPNKIAVSPENKYLFILGNSGNLIKITLPNLS